MKASKKGPPFSSSGVEARLPMPSVSRANGIRVYPSGPTTKLKPPQGPTSKKVTMPCSARRSSVARATSRHRWIRLPMWTCLSRNNGGQPVCGSGLIRAWSLISSHSTTCARVPEPLRTFRSSGSYWGRTRSQGSDASGAVSISSVMSEVRGCSEAGAACRRLSMVEQKCRNARSRRFTTRLYYRPVCPNRPGWSRSIRRRVERFIDQVMQRRRRKPQRSALRVRVEVEGDRELVADLSRPGGHRSDNEREKAQEARPSTRYACWYHRRDYKGLFRVKKAGAASFTASPRPPGWNRTGGTGGAGRWKGASPLSL